MKASAYSKEPFKTLRFSRVIALAVFTHLILEKLEQYCQYSMHDNMFETSLL